MLLSFCSGVSKVATIFARMSSHVVSGFSSITQSYQTLWVPLKIIGRSRFQ